MSPEPRIRDPRRKITKTGYVVHVYHPRSGGSLYVPIVPAWGAAGLRRTLEGLDGGRRSPCPD